MEMALILFLYAMGMVMTVALMNCAIHHKDIPDASASSKMVAVVFWPVVAFVAFLGILFGARKATP